jgi:hypothetical protein
MARGGRRGGARFVALLIVVSSLGFLAVVILISPRLYYAMATDGLSSGAPPPCTLAITRRCSRCGFRRRALVLLTTNTYDQLLSPRSSPIGSSSV